MVHDWIYLQLLSESEETPELQTPVGAVALGGLQRVRKCAVLVVFFFIVWSVCFPCYVEHFGAGSCHVRRYLQHV